MHKLVEEYIEQTKSSETIDTTAAATNFEATYPVDDAPLTNAATGECSALQPSADVDF